MAVQQERGKSGETYAAHYLRANGYEILAMNWRAGRAEVDIIAKTERCFCFVEVKTRSSTAYGNPEQFVTATKQRLLIDAAEAYLEKETTDFEVRFDVISIVLTANQPELTHFEDAFGSEW